MSLDKLFSWIAGIVIACAAVGQLDALQNWLMRAQACRGPVLKGAILAQGISAET